MTEYRSKKICQSLILKVRHSTKTLAFTGKAKMMERIALLSLLLAGGYCKVVKEKQEKQGLSCMCINLVSSIWSGLGGPPVGQVRVQLPG